MPYNLKRTCLVLIASRWSKVMGQARTLHRDEQGTISILSVITLLMLTMLMGMILNVGEQIDDKIKMQNAADAASYSSGVVIARGLNTVAFTNHLLSETFALTAYFREGRDRYAESLVPEILDRWKIVGEQLGLSNFKLIRDIQPAIAPKIQMERELVEAFGDMTAIKSRLILPALETILGISEIPQNAAASSNPQDNAASHLIPTFQRAVVQAIPSASYAISNEIAKRNSPGRNRRSTQCVIWSLQTDPLVVVDERDPLERLLPALDPSMEGPDFPYLSSGEVHLYQQMARNRRDDLARHYLSEWIRDESFDLGPFERETLATGGRVSGKMSQFINLFRGFTCAKLNFLLNEEYPRTNLPHMLRQPLDRLDRATYEERTKYDAAGNLVVYHRHFHARVLSQQQYLDLDYTFYGFVYRQQRTPTMPGMYRVPIEGDAFAFAGVSVYLPRPRYDTSPGCPRYWGRLHDHWGGTSPCDELPHHDYWPTEWSLFSQNWAARIIPASTETVISLLNKNPEQLAPGVKLPNFSSIQVQDLKAINFH